MLILVTGATGTLGRQVVQELRHRDHEVRALSRRPHPPRDGVAWFTGDLTTGQHLEPAVAGADAVIHAAGDSRHYRKEIPAVRNLLRAAGDAHVVTVSIVGCDRMPLGYYRVKTEIERIMAEDGRRWTVLRATQFHDLIRSVCAALARSPIVPVLSRSPLQPVAAADVAVRLADLAERLPLQDLAPDLGGPEVRPMADLMRAYLRSAGKRRAVLPVHVPGKLGRALRAGTATCPDQRDGKQTWEEFLAGR